MNFKSGLLFIAISAASYGAKAQVSTTTDLAVEFIPHWQKGETHSISVNNYRSDYTQKLNPNDTLVCNLTYKVLELNRVGYKVEWQYNYVNASKPNPEAQVFTLLLNTPLVLQYSGRGQIVNLVNAEAIKALLNKGVEDLLKANKEGTPLHEAYLGYQSVLKTQEDFENWVLKSIKTYNSPFNGVYHADVEERSGTKYPHRALSSPVSAELISLVSNNDSGNMTCTLDLTHVIDATPLTVANLSPKALSETNTDSTSPSWQLAEKTTYVLNYGTGIVQSVHIEKTAIIGNINEVESTDIFLTR